MREAVLRGGFLRDENDAERAHEVAYEIPDGAATHHLTVDRTEPVAAAGRER